jgi:hypothetical protein
VRKQSNHDIATRPAAPGNLARSRWFINKYPANSNSYSDMTDVTGKAELSAAAAALTSELLS